MLPANSLQMHEITVSPTIASVLFVLSACSFTKICHWREIHNDWTTCTAQLQENSRESDKRREQRKRENFLLNVIT